MADMKAVAIHQFMFPFYICGSGRKRFKVADWEKAHPTWQKQIMQASNENYGLRHYFHNEVSRLLWDRHPDKDENLSLNHYIYKICGGSYEIKVHRTEYGTRLDYDYQLEVPADGIQLYLLDSLSIGILSLTVHSASGELSTEDILRINQWGRRIYWPFINLGGSEPFCTECADELALKLKIAEGNEANWCEDFRMDGDRQKGFKPQYAVFIQNLLHGIPFQHILDDRMFTSCFCSSDVAGSLASIWPEYRLDHTSIYPVKIDPVEPNCKEKELENSRRTAGREATEFWYRMCYVDIGLTCLNANMRYELLKSITYDRWSDWGTFFGYTHYSFMMLVSPSAPDYLRQHFLQHYHYMTVILLLQRAALICFADQVNYLADQHIVCHNDSGPRKMPSKQRKLMLEGLTDFRKKYILFINKVWFDEVSPQEQGIELYELGKRVMMLEKHKDSLRSDIDELYQFGKAEEDANQKSLLDWLSLLGVIFVPLSFWSTFLAMGNPDWLFVSIANLSVMVFCAFVVIGNKQLKLGYKIPLIVYIIIAAMHLSLFFLLKAPIVQGG